MKEIREGVPRLRGADVQAARGHARGRGEEGGAGDGRSRPGWRRRSLDRVSRRDPKKVYHRTGAARAWRSGAGLRLGRSTSPRVGTPEVQALNVTHPPFFGAGGAARAEDVPARSWRAYLAWRCVSAQVTALPKAFQDASVRLHAARRSPARRRTAALEEVRRAPPTRASGEALARALRREDLRRRRQGGDQAMVKEIEQAVRGEPRRAALDGRGHQGRAPREAAQGGHQQDRLPRQVARPTTV